MGESLTYYRSFGPAQDDKKMSFVKKADNGLNVICWNDKIRIFVSESFNTHGDSAKAKERYFFQVKIKKHLL